MTIVVRAAESPQDSSLWESYVKCHPASTVYHRLAWRDVFERSLHYRSWLLMAHQSGTDVQGVLPLYLVPSPFGSRICAVPFRDRGGPVWDTPAALTALIEAAKRIHLEAGARSLVLKTLYPLPDAVVRETGLHLDEHWLHSVLDLQGLDEGALWRSIGPKTRNMIRQARQHGLGCRVVTDPARALEHWYPLHIDTQKRLGIPPFPKRFFEVMLAELARDGSAQLLLVTHADKPCAAALLLLHGVTCIYGYGASTIEGHRLRANDLMIFESIKLALGQRLRLFDFGSDSPLQENLLFFKRKWGAVQSPLPRYGAGAVFGADSSQSQYAFLRAIVRRLPECLLATTVARFTRYFG